MKHLRRVPFGFGLGAAGLILTAVLWINSDYYTTLLASHSGYHPVLPTQFGLVSPLPLRALLLFSASPAFGCGFLVVALRGLLQ